MMTKTTIAKLVMRVALLLPPLPTERFAVLILNPRSRNPVRTSTVRSGANVGESVSISTKMGLVLWPVINTSALRRQVAAVAAIPVAVLAIQRRWKEAGGEPWNLQPVTRERRAKR
jgi:hypothetical protein